jgi:hypothetical protein
MVPALFSLPPPPPPPPPYSAFPPDDAAVGPRWSPPQPPKPPRPASESPCVEPWIVGLPPGTIVENPDPPGSVAVVPALPVPPPPPPIPPSLLPPVGEEYSFTAGMSAPPPPPNALRRILSSGVNPDETCTSVSPPATPLVCAPAVPAPTMISSVAGRASAEKHAQANAPPPPPAGPPLYRAVPPPDPPAPIHSIQTIETSAGFVHPALCVPDVSNRWKSTFGATSPLWPAWFLAVNPLI